MPDEVIMERALQRFEGEAREKFMAGIQKHNPDGSRNLTHMPLEQKIKNCKKEIIDLWFYLNTMEDKLHSMPRSKWLK